MKIKPFVLSVGVAGLIFSGLTRQEGVPLERAGGNEVVRLFTRAIQMTVRNGVVADPRQLENIMGRMEEVKEPGLLPLLERISRLAETIPDAAQRCKIFGWAIQQMAPLDLKRALAKAKSRPDCDQQAWLRDISHRLALEDPSRALAVAERIQNPFYRAHAWIVIARYLAPADPERSRQILEEARSLLESHRLLEARRRLLAWGYLPVDPRETLKILLPARDLNGINRWQYFDLVYEAAGGDPAIAEQLSEALGDSYIQARLLARIAVEWMRRDPVHAGGLLDRALTLAESMKDPLTQDLALHNIVKEIAGADSSFARKVAQKIRTPLYRARALTALASAVRQKSPEEARALLKEALNEARNIEPQDLSAFAELSEIASLFWSTAPEEASRLMTEASIAAAGADHGRDAYLAAGILEKGARLGWARALELAETVGVDSERVRAMTCAALAYSGYDPVRSLEVLRHASAVAVERSLPGSLAIVAATLHHLHHGNTEPAFSPCAAPVDLWQKFGF